MNVSSDKYKKNYSAFSGVRSKSKTQENPKAWSIFVRVPGLQNMIFNSQGNMPACKKSAPFGPFSPCFVSLKDLEKLENGLFDMPNSNFHGT